MGFLANIITGVAWVLNSVLTICFVVVIASALISWVNPDPYNPIVRFLRNATEPLYVYIRRYVPFVYLGGFDLSRIVVILLIEFLRYALVQNLYYLARTLAPQMYPM